MKITITPLDLQKGVKNDPYGCPVALACLRATNSLYGGVLASYKCLLIGSKNFSVSPELRDFMKAYDQGYQLEPMEFELEDKWVLCGATSLSS